MDSELEILKRRLERERLARVEAEKLLEEKSFELYQSNQKLKLLNVELEDSIQLKTQKLEATESEYHILVESINDLIIKTDLNGEITYANQIAGRIFDPDRKHSILGKNVFDFLTDELRKQTSYFFCRQYIKKNCVNYLELPLMTANQTKKWFGLSVQFSEERCLTCEKKLCIRIRKDEKFSASAECIYQNVIIVAHDITEQKLARLELEKSERRYRELTEFLPELICEINTKGELIYVNKFALDKFGYTNDEVINSNFNFLTIFDPEDRSRVIRNVENLLKYGGQLSNEYLALKKKWRTISGHSLFCTNL